MESSQQLRRRHTLCKELSNPIPDLKGRLAVIHCDHLQSQSPLRSFSRITSDHLHFTMSYAALSAISVIENPRTPPNKSNTVVFDAHFFTGDREGMLGCVEYYNDEELDFNFKGTKMCLIEGKVCYLCRL
jgi:hypothetical protein